MEKGNRIFHRLDRYFGIPIVFVLGLFKIKRNFELKDSINKIALVNLGSIGDNVLMSAVIRDLKSRFPKSEIIVFTGSTNFGIVSLIEGVTPVKLPITNFFKSIKIIRSYSEFEIAIDFGPWPRLNAIYSFFVKANFRVGFKSKGQYRHFVYDLKIEHSNEIHEIDNHRNLISFLYQGKRHLPKINGIKSIASIGLTNSVGRFCIIHAWSGGLRKELKEWPDEKWVSLVTRIIDDFDFILLTGSSADISDTDRLCEKIRINTNAKSKVRSIAGDFSIGETIYIMEKASLIISIDTGNAHIAAAIGSSLICLQGPANSLRWRPYSEKAIVINPDKGNYGYLNFGFEFDEKRENCMENISVDTVYNAYLALSNK